MAFGDWPRELVAEVARLPEELMPPSLGKLWAKRGLFARLARIGTSARGRGPVTEVVESPPRLERRPALRTWPRDGGRVVTLPLVHTAEPETGVLRPPRDALRGYTSLLLPQPVRPAGHAVFVAPAAGGYVEHWGVEPDPRWSMAGVVRYRSRRDLMELATDPGFEDIHAYKLAAMSHTLAFPATPAVTLFGPRVWVALLLGLLAALAHLALGRR